VSGGGEKGEKKAWSSRRLGRRGKPDTARKWAIRRYTKKEKEAEIVFRGRGGRGGRGVEKKGTIRTEISLRRGRGEKDPLLKGKRKKKKCEHPNRNLNCAGGKRGKEKTYYFLAKAKKK